MAAKPEKAAVLKALDDARRNLADNQGDEKARAAVDDAEQQARFGHARGWRQ